LRGRLLDELLVTALDRAVAFAEMDHGSLSVRDHLHLDVAGVFEEALDVDGRVGEVRLALALSRGERPLGLRGRADDLQPLAPTACRGLDRQRPTVFGPDRQDVGHRLHGLGRPRDNRHAGALHQPAGGHLGAHSLDRLWRRTDPDEAGVLDGPREGGILGEEPVARVDRIRFGLSRGLEHAFLVEVAVGRSA
jgi:hypothetical protein